MRRIHLMPYGTQRQEADICFRLWAPSANNVKLCLYDERKQKSLLDMTQADSGMFSVSTSAAAVGSSYHYLIDDDLLVPDPVSRCQVDDVHGPSIVIEPLDYDWQDENWTTPEWESAILYELHVGTFTEEGTFKAAAEKLDHLVELGVSAIELMPVADFPGRHGWGYDGVLLFAPDRQYGSPAELKALIDQAHQRGLMIFLDVVYNHFGPEGNYLWVYAKSFFSDKYATPWGSAINFDGRGSDAVRQFYIHNALYWLQEYNFDGLRLDAVHAIQDQSRPHILEQLVDEINRQIGHKRRVHLCLENDRNAASWLARNSQGRANRYVAQWNDDIHHALHVITTGESEGYYADYSRETSARSATEHLGRCLTQGFSYQGDSSNYHAGINRGECSKDLPASAFVSFLQNHDQIGNRAFGERILRLAEPEAVRAAVSIVLLSPQIPMLFMGEEFGSTTPFLLFCDLGDELAPLVREGRRKEFSRFPQFCDLKSQQRIPDPCTFETFLACKIDWRVVESGSAAGWFDFYKRLIAVRKEKLIPLLSKSKDQDGSFWCQSPSLLALQCKIGTNATLSLLANMSALPSKVSAQLASVVAAGQDIFDLGNTRRQLALEEPLAAWSVLWVVKNDFS